MKMTSASPRDRRVPVKAVAARRRLVRVEDRCLAHLASIRGYGDGFVPPRAVLVMLEDLLATARGEVA